MNPKMWLIQCCPAMFYDPSLLRNMAVMFILIYRIIVCFACKIEIYFTEWTPDVIFSRCDIFTSCIARSKNIRTGVHKWNIIWSCMQNKQIFYLFHAILGVLNNFTAFCCLTTCALVHDLIKSCCHMSLWCWKIFL
jgi:hypothetical protein